MDDKRTEKKKIGDWGEEQASVFLLEKGYQIVDKKYRIKTGEIDIVAWHDKYHFGKTLCFVEVKTRTFGKPKDIFAEFDYGEEGCAERATNKSKLSRIQNASRYYCLDKNIDIGKTPIQFEQISIYIHDINKKFKIYHYVIPIN